MTRAKFNKGDLVVTRAGNVWEVIEDTPYGVEVMDAYGDMFRRLNPNGLQIAGHDYSLTFRQIVASIERQGHS